MRITERYSECGDHDGDTDAAIDAILAHLDKDKKGALSFDEFSLGIKTYPPLVKIFSRYNIADERESSSGTTQVSPEPHNRRSRLRLKKDAPGGCDDGCGCAIT